jgi:hypothetical protein
LPPCVDETKQGTGDMQNHSSLGRTQREVFVIEEDTDLDLASIPTTDEEGQRSDSVEGSITPPPLGRVPEPARMNGVEQKSIGLYMLWQGELVLWLHGLRCRFFAPEQIRR